MYQITEGVAAKSYGLNVARLAQIPEDIILTAESYSHQLEKITDERRLVIKIMP